MTAYLVRRVLLFIPLLLGITLVTFGVMQLAPGGPADAIMDMNAKVSPEARQRLEKLYGMDKPWPVRYANWLFYLSRLDFGRSFKDERPVLDKILERLPATLLLNVCSLLLILAAAIPIGVASALRPGAWFDRLMTAAVFVGFSTPTFWLALLLMIAFGLRLGVLPISGLHALNHDEMGFLARQWDTARHLVLPVFVSAFTGLAGLSRYVRNGMLEVVRQDYIRTARAKGLPEGKIIFKHALRNVLIPVITILGLSLPDLIGGGFIFETIFAYPGMGRLGFEALMARDANMIMGIGTLTAVLTLLGNFLADVCYRWADPRIREGGL
jgi:peptide/nickel transport system permease protein